MIQTLLCHKRKLEITTWQMKNHSLCLQINFVIRNKISGASDTKIQTFFKAWVPIWVGPFLGLQAHGHSHAGTMWALCATLLQAWLQPNSNIRAWQKPSPADVKQQFSSEQMISWISQQGVTTFSCQWLNVWPLGCNFHQFNKSPMQTWSYFSLCC